MKKHKVTKTFDSIETGKNIKRLLKEHKLSSNFVANTLLINRTTLYYWINGSNRISIDYLCELASLLDVEITDIIVMKDTGRTND